MLIFSGCAAKIETTEEHHVLTLEIPHETMDPHHPYYGGEWWIKGVPEITKTQFFSNSILTRLSIAPASKAFPQCLWLQKNNLDHWHFELYASTTSLGVKQAIFETLSEFLLRSNYRFVSAYKLVPTFDLRPNPKKSDLSEVAFDLDLDGEKDLLVSSSKVTSSGGKMFEMFQLKRNHRQPIGSLFFKVLRPLGNDPTHGALLLTFTGSGSGLYGAQIWCIANTRLRELARVENLPGSEAARSEKDQRFFELTESEMLTDDLLKRVFSIDFQRGKWNEQKLPGAWEIPL